MTNVFGINVTEDKKTKECDKSIFLLKTVSPQINTEIESLADHTIELADASDISLPLNIIFWICRVAGLLLVVAILNSYTKTNSFVVGYKNAPALFWIAGICVLVSVVLWIMKKRKEKQTPKEATEKLDDESKVIYRKIRDELGVPDDAQTMDFFTERYVIKDGKAVHKSFLMTEYETIAIDAFVENGNLYLADTERCLSIPLSDLKTPEFINKRVNFVDWNKQEPPDSPKYKPFDIRTNQFGACFSRYYRVEVCDTRGEYYLLIPEYDIETFNMLTQESMQK